MEVPPGAGPGSLVQFEPPLPQAWQGSSLDGDLSPPGGTQSWEEEPPPPLDRVEVRLDVAGESLAKQASLAHAMMSAHGRDFFDEAVVHELLE
jgi:hypothetical protein